MQSTYSSFLPSHTHNETNFPKRLQIVTYSTMNYNNNSPYPVTKKAKTSVGSMNNKVSLKCDYCDYSTKIQTRRAASNNLIKHMQQSEICCTFLKHCSNTKCTFVCIAENALTMHISQKPACRTAYHTTAATQREIMAISTSSTYASNDICNRDPNLVKRHYNNITVPNQGLIVDHPPNLTANTNQHSPERNNRLSVSTLSH